MLDIKYTIMIASVALAITSGCTRVSQHVLPFDSASEFLNWEDSALFLKAVHSPAKRHRHLDSSHIAYLAKLQGQACTAKKWTELTLKALRTRSATRSIENLGEATYAVDATLLRKGDIISFASRPRAPAHAVIAEHLGQHTYTAYTLVNKRITKIKVNPKFASQRRRQGRIINSFIRTIKPKDSKGGYLAGEMVIGAARPETGF